MECQKIINLLDNVSNQASKFRTKNWIEINDQSRGVYKVNSDIRFKTTMLKSSYRSGSNNITMMKNYRLSKKQEGLVLITVGVQL